MAFGLYPSVADYIQVVKIIKGELAMSTLIFKRKSRYFGVQSCANSAFLYTVMHFTAK